VVRSVSYDPPKLMPVYGLLVFCTLTDLLFHAAAKKSLFTQKEMRQAQTFVLLAWVLSIAAGISASVSLSGEKVVMKTLTST
jgi:hypothetical protein